MNRVLSLAVVGLFLMSGCAVVRVPADGRRSSRNSIEHRRPECHPSQYWDGEQCRHKGKGHGARKHDGNGRHGHRD